jgi:hypothetical protein
VDTWAPSMHNIGHSAQARVSVQRHPYGRRQQFHAGRGVMERRREGIFSQGEKQRAYTEISIPRELEIHSDTTSHHAARRVTTVGVNKNSIHSNKSRFRSREGNPWLPEVR